MRKSGEPFLELLARPQPNPGGGAAAAYGASLALALLEKVILLERGRHDVGTAEAAFWEDQLTDERALSGDLANLRDQDVHAYAALSEAMASAHRATELPAALQEAIHCPLRIMNRAADGLMRIEEVGMRCKKHLLADVQVACELLGAVIDGAYHIARANLYLVKDAPNRSSTEVQLADGRRRCRAHFVRVSAKLSSRIWQ